MPGVDRQRVGEVLIRASGASLILERKLSALVAHDYRAGFGRLDSSGLLNLLEPSPGLSSPGVRGGEVVELSASADRGLTLSLRDG